MSVECKKSPPPPQPNCGHVFRWIKISRTILEKGHPRNNPLKLFQILTSGFGEDFLRISSCSYSAKSPSPPTPPWWPRFSTDQNFANNFEKGHLRNIPVNFFPNQTRGFREEDFLRISACRYSAKSLPPMAAMFFDRSKFHEQVLKKANTRNNPVKLFQNRGLLGDATYQISKLCTF